MTVSHTSVSPTTTASKRGFAAMDPERLRQIASAGGVARREAYKLARRNAQMRAAPQARMPAQSHFAASPS